MSKLTGDDLVKELTAQKKRAEALAYLQTHGCGPGRTVEKSYSCFPIEIEILKL